VGGCDALHSDSENAQRQSRAEHASRLRGMREATRQTPGGTPVTGEELRALVAGRTHVSVYAVSPTGARERYVEYAYFEPDGHFVYLNSSWATRPDGDPTDRWRVDGPRLCVLNHAFGPDERCYTIRVTPAGHVQYYVDAPGADTDGLLTREIEIVQPGRPRVDAP
jgi:hypothetical protein